jgi:hypothetical protein
MAPESFEVQAMTEPTGEKGPEGSEVFVLGTALFGPFAPDGGPGLAPEADLEFDDERLRRIDRVTRLCLRGASKALEDGGLRPGEARRESCGLYLGNAYGAWEANLRHQRIILEQGGRFASPAVFSNTLANVAAGWVSIVEGLKGPLFTFVGSALAGAEAVSCAGLCIREGSSGPMLAGGAHAFNEDVHRVRTRARGREAHPPAECSAFLLLSGSRPGKPCVALKGWGLARASGVSDPLDRAVADAIGEAGPPDAWIVAGDAARDEEARVRLEAMGARGTVVVSEGHGDLAEAAPTAGAVLGARWLLGAWRPEGESGPVQSVLVAGLDPCARRAFALLFALSG